MAMIMAYVKELTMGEVTYESKICGARAGWTVNANIDMTTVLMYGIRLPDARFRKCLLSEWR